MTAALHIPGVNTDMGLWWPTVVGWVLLAAAFVIGRLSKRP